MHKLQEKIISSKLGKGLLATTVGSSAIILSSNMASAAGAEGITEALTTTAADITATLTGVAPIGLGIVGVFLAWKYGIKFFKGLSK